MFSITLPSVPRPWLTGGSCSAASSAAPGCTAALPRVLVGPAGVRRRPKVELLTPAGGPDAAFLERFLAAHGAGPHHFNFIVSDIEATLARVRALGIEPVGVNLAGANWKEAFLHPRDVHGIVIQVAWQGGTPPSDAPPEELPAAGPAAMSDLIEYHVGDLPAATRLFADVLQGTPETSGGDAASSAGPAASGSGWCARKACRSAGRCTTSASPGPAARSAPRTGNGLDCWPSASG